jgi:hypothetical protein
MLCALATVPPDAAAAEKTVTGLLQEPAIRASLEQAFGASYPAFVRAMIDPRISVRQRRADCFVRRHGEYRIAVCGAFGDPYGAGSLVVSAEASQHIAGFVHDAVDTIRASEDWARRQPDSVSDLLRRFSQTLPVGIIGKING